jgi:hypothetical protein
MPEAWLLFIAEREGRPIATSLIALRHPRGHGGRPGSVAYGRYWGALERVDCLHFEACYYQPLQWCMTTACSASRAAPRANTRWRGPCCRCKTTSAHWLAHPAFADALQRAPAGDGHASSCFRACPPATHRPCRCAATCGGWATGPAGWNQGFNFGPRAGVLKANGTRGNLRPGHRRKVSLIGWSLGGIYARELAKEMPTWCAASSRWARRSPVPTRAPTPGAVRTDQRARHRARNSPLRPAPRSPGAHHIRFSRARTASWPGRPACSSQQRSQPAHRKHRGRGQPRRHRAEPQRLVGCGRPAVAARGRLAALSSARRPAVGPLYPDPHR